MEQMLEKKNNSKTSKYYFTYQDGRWSVQRVEPEGKEDRTVRTALDFAVDDQ